jgi:flagellar hook-associated protein 1
MSVTSALSSALSGLTATARMAETTSSNVANASTPGYVRRQVELGAAVLGGSGQGVTVRGVLRDVDQFLLNDRRLAQAETADRDARAAFLGVFERAVGTSDQPGSLSGRIAAFDQALMEAASRPESDARLGAAAAAARSLAEALNAASDVVQTERMRADARIEADVATLNAALRQVADLNASIQSFSGAGRDVSALLDQRQQAVDRIASIVPLREMPRPGNQVALYTTAGAALVDGPPATFGFTRTPTIVPEMTLASGALSGLTLNGRPVATEGPAAAVSGGSLSALFALRDDLAVSAQAGLDGLARDLAERFGAGGPDPTLAPGAPGLFTDGGDLALPANEPGLAARLALNAAADPAAGGSARALRDGLAFAGVPQTGDATLLLALSDALTAARPTATAAFPAGSRSLPGLAAEMLGRASSNRLSAEGAGAQSAARLAALEEMEAAGGVDTDAELQALLVIERNYAANARVIQTVDDMIATLIGL